MEEPTQSLETVLAEYKRVLGLVDAILEKQAEVRKKMVELQASLYSKLADKPAIQALDRHDPERFIMARDFILRVVKPSGIFTMDDICAGYGPLLWKIAGMESDTTSWDRMIKWLNHWVSEKKLKRVRLGTLSAACDRWEIVHEDTCHSSVA